MFDTKDGDILQGKFLKQTRDEHKYTYQLAAGNNFILRNKDTHFLNRTRKITRKQILKIAFKKL